MATMTASSTVYNTTDGPLIIDDEGRIVAARDRVKVTDLDAEPIAGHLEAGRLVDVTDAKADGADAEEQLDAQLVEPDDAGDDAATKPKARKGATTTPRS